MSAFDAINLSSLPAPDVVETLSFEEIHDAWLSDLRQRNPRFSALVESDPVFSLSQAGAYRELLIRQRVNDASRALLLASARGSDLDHLAAFYKVTRKLITPEDATTSPPTKAVYESDNALRERVQLAPEGLTAAGTKGAYRFWSLSAHNKVKDVSVTGPVGGVVQVAVLSYDGNGQPDGQTISAVEAQLNAEDIRPLTDTVRVVAAAIYSYSVDADLILYPGPDANVVLQNCYDKVNEYVRDQHRCGRDIIVAGLHAALMQPGVQRVTLTNITSDIQITPERAAWCSGINLTLAGYAEE